MSHRTRIIVRSLPAIVVRLSYDGRGREGKGENKWWGGWGGEGGGVCRVFNGSPFWLWRPVRPQVVPGEVSSCRPGHWISLIANSSSKFLTSTTVSVELHKVLSLPFISRVDITKFYDGLLSQHLRDFHWKFEDKFRGFVWVFKRCVKIFHLYPIYS